MHPLQPRNGFWGQVTSTLDWCEVNYEVTYYIAEFWNTLSNLFMIIPPLFGIYKTYSFQLKSKYYSYHTCLLIVGLGSWCFHMTLYYHMQLMDELPMVWGSLYLFYQLTIILHPSLEKGTILQLSVLAYGLIETIIYLVLINPLIHQIGYGIIVAALFYLDVRILKTKPCEPRLFYASTFLYYTGFFLWNIDNMYCEELQELRTKIPKILVPFTQFHALWHCFAGYGSYLQTLYCKHARANSENMDATVEWEWALLGVHVHVQKPKKQID